MEMWSVSWTLWSTKTDSDKTFLCPTNSLAIFPRVFQWSAEPIFEPAVSRSRLTAKNKENKRSQLTLGETALYLSGSEVFSAFYRIFQ